MGCVYSYPLFSFQGSICFSAAKIILSNLHSLVKHFFIFIFVLFTDIRISRSYCIRFASACQCFYLKTFQSSAISVIRFSQFAPPFSREHLYIIHACRKMSTPFFTFSLFLFKPLIFPQFHYLSISRPHHHLSDINTGGNAQQERLLFRRLKGRSNPAPRGKAV